MFRSVRLLAALFVVLTATTANAQWASIKCTSPGIGVPERYPKPLCDAEDLMRKGRYTEAIRAFGDAAFFLDWFTLPNLSFHGIQ
jgi:hypothetical protein